MAIVERQLASGDTKYWVVVNIGGKRKWIDAGTESQRASHLHDELMVKARNRELPTADDRIPLSKFARKWMREGCGHLKPSTLSGYESKMRVHIIPTLGEQTRIRNITVERLHQMVALWRQQGLSDSLIANNMVALSAMCRWAVDTGYMSTNPCHKVRLRRKPKSVNRVLLSLEQLHAVIAHTPKEHRSLMTVLCMTGMRPQSEACALKWDDIDWRAGVVHVRRSVWKGQLTDSPKNGKPRQIPMSDSVRSAFSEQRTQRLSGDIIFPSKPGGILNMSHWAREVFIPSAKRAGIATEGLRLYQIRHSVITVMVNAGVPIPAIAEVCGTSRQLVLDTYAGVAADGTARAMDALGQQGVLEKKTA